MTGHVPLFKYSGPAKLAGEYLPQVDLLEDRGISGTGVALLRSWGGSAVWDAGVPVHLLKAGPVTLELPGVDGTGQVYVQAESLDGQVWQLEMVGVGPPPGLS